MEYFILQWVECWKNAEVPPTNNGNEAKNGTIKKYHTKKCKNKFVGI